MGAIPMDGSHSTRSMPQSFLLDDLDNAAGARIDQNRAAVHNRITIIPSTIFRRYIVVVDALIRQHSANSDVLTILIGRAALLDDIIAKARTLIDAQNAGYATDHATNHTADDGADRTGRSFAISRAALNSAGDPLGLGCNR